MSTATKISKIIVSFLLCLAVLSLNLDSSAGAQSIIVTKTSSTFTKAAALSAEKLANQKTAILAPQKVTTTTTTIAPRKTTTTTTVRRTTTTTTVRRTTTTTTVQRTTTTTVPKTTTNTIPAAELADLAAQKKAADYAAKNPAAPQVSSNTIKGFVGCTYVSREGAARQVDCAGTNVVIDIFQACKITRFDTSLALTEKSREDFATFLRDLVTARDNHSLVSYYITFTGNTSHNIGNQCPSMSAPYIYIDEHTLAMDRAIFSQNHSPGSLAGFNVTRKGISTGDLERAQVTYVDWYMVATECVSVCSTTTTVPVTTTTSTTLPPFCGTPGHAPCPTTTTISPTPGSSGSTGSSDSTTSTTFPTNPITDNPWTATDPNVSIRVYVDTPAKFVVGGNYMPQKVTVTRVVLYCGAIECPPTLVLGSYVGTLTQSSTNPNTYKDCSNSISLNCAWKSLVTNPSSFSSSSSKSGEMRIGFYSPTPYNIFAKTSVLLTSNITQFERWYRSDLCGGAAETALSPDGCYVLKSIDRTDTSDFVLYVNGLLQTSHDILRAVVGSVGSK
jgi:hypothetical protein